MSPTRKSYLDNLVNAGTISPDSRNFLIGALDPFHDFEYEAKGIPDTFAGNSVVQFLKKQINISAPSSLPDGSLWDCHIVSFPTLDTNSYTDVTSSFFDVQPGAAALNLGTISVLKGISGFPLLPNDPTWIPTLFHYSSTGFSPSDDGNQFSISRIPGGAFEVTNTTAELYRNGSVCVYSQPQETQYNSYYNSGNQLLQTRTGRLPPATLSQANSNINSVTWAAAEGCYVPLRLDLNDTQFQLATSVPMMHLAKDDTSGGYSSGVLQDIATAGTQFLRATEGTRYAGLETVGAYFTGLSKQTTLTLTIRFINEIAPTPSNQTLISLAKPSCEFDPAAMALYTKAIRELPPGTMVKNNADGDWWKVISGAVKAVAPVISQMGPQGKVVGGIASGLVGAVDAGRALASHVRNDPTISKMRQDIKEVRDAAKKDKKKPPPKKQEALRNSTAKHVGGAWRDMARASK